MESLPFDIMSAMFLAMIVMQLSPKSSAKLIPCPDCGKKISPRAIACPHCGAPNSVTQSSDSTGNRDEN